MFELVFGLLFFLERTVATSSDVNPGWTPVEGSGSLEEAARFLANLGDPAAAFQRVVTLYESHGARLGSCSGSADLASASACFRVTADFANLTESALDAGHDLVELFYDLAGDLREINDCQNASIFQKFHCYMKAFGDTQALVQRYAVEMSQILVNASVAFVQFGADLHACFSSDPARLAERLEKNVALCGLKSI